MSQLKHLTGESALAFLLTHNPEDAEHLGCHIPLKSKQSSSVVATAESTNQDIVHDLPATLTVVAQSFPDEPVKQDITVTVSSLNLEFTHTGLFSYPPTIPHPLKDAWGSPGTLYLVKQNPVAGQVDWFNANNTALEETQSNIPPERARRI
ncbi:hypothetical protein BU15DRAFT_74084 [Melanogaster broomeanus]|nr:hypothetical protein BU15DRAFT_74084 [Melanogaster broomeanus]